MTPETADFTAEELERERQYWAQEAMRYEYEAYVVAQAEAQLEDWDDDDEPAGEVW